MHRTRQVRPEAKRIADNAVDRDRPTELAAARLHFGRGSEESIEKLRPWKLPQAARPGPTGQLQGLGLSVGVFGAVAGGMKAAVRQGSGMTNHRAVGFCRRDSQERVLAPFALRKFDGGNLR